MPAKYPQTTHRRIRVNRRDIGRLKFILEGYDNLATLTTLESTEHGDGIGWGCLELRVAPGCETDVDGLLGQLKRQIMIELAN